MLRQLLLLAVVACTGAVALAAPTPLDGPDIAPEWLPSLNLCPADVIAPEPFDPVKQGLESCLDDTEGCNTPDRCLEDPEACIERCGGGDPSSCFYIARGLEQEDSMSVFAQRFFLLACKLGHDPGCTNSAAMLLARRGQDRASRLACAQRTFESICGRGEPWACTMMGRVLSWQMQSDGDRETALGFLRRACTLGTRRDACETAEEIEESIRSRVLDADEGEAGPSR